MKRTLSFLLLALAFQLGVAQDLKVGDKAPSFKLNSTDEKLVSLEDYNSKKGVIVIFTCNHCPYAKAYEDRIIALQTNYGETYPVLAINPNDASEYPDDSFENMKVRAKEKKFNFPYLHDESQATAQAYGAKKTPHVYVLKKVKDGFEVVYIGAIDDNYTNAKKAKKKYVEEAITAIELGKVVSTNSTAAVGCSIKWKKE